jgi:hypothetical protein
VSGRFGAAADHATLLRDAVASAAVLMATRPELDRDERTGLAVSRIMFATRVFERLDGDHDLEALASLAQYNLGAAGSEAFECVVMGKGNGIRGALMRQLKLGRAECLD